MERMNQLHGYSIIQPQNTLGNELGFRPAAGWDG